MMMMMMLFMNDVDVGTFAFGSFGGIIYYASGFQLVAYVRN